MQLRFGSLLNVYGTPGHARGYTFMPSDIVLEGTPFTPGFPLGEQQGPLAPVLRRAVDEGIDAAWVRARIPKVFGFTPDAAEIEKALLETGFVAVTEDRLVGYPFVCVDHYGRTALMFSDDGPEREVKQGIARAFWELLLRDPDDLTDFEERVFHPGACIWLTHGCESDGSIATSRKYRCANVEEAAP